MLVLSRKKNEKIVIQLGPDLITVTVCEIDRVKVRLGFEAPQNVLILREELRERHAQKEPGKDAA